MIQLRFEGAPNAETKTIRSSRFRLDGTRVMNAKGTVVAEVTPGIWKVDGRCATRWTCNGPVSVEFEFDDGRKRRQSYPSLYGFGAVLRDGTEYLAMLDGEHWRSFQTRDDLRAITLS